MEHYAAPEMNYAMGNNMNESYKHNTEQKREHIVCDFALTFKNR